MRALDSSANYDAEYVVACGLEPEKRGAPRGEGDEKIIKAVKVLRDLQAQGKIRKIGMSGKSAFCLSISRGSHV